MWKQKKKKQLKEIQNLSIPNVGILRESAAPITFLTDTQRQTGNCENIVQSETLEATGQEGCRQAWLGVHGEPSLISPK